jgi:hypothetical protein
MGGLTLSCQPTCLSDAAPGASAEVGQAENTGDVGLGVEETRFGAGVSHGETREGRPYAPRTSKWGVFEDSPVTDDYYDRTYDRARTSLLLSFCSSALLSFRPARL